MAVDTLTGIGLPSTALTQYSQEFTLSDVSYAGNGSWTNRTSPVATTNWFGVGYGNGKFVAVGNGGATSRVAYSTDGGVTWSASVTGISGNINLYAALYANSTWVIVGAQQQAYTSTDGIAWTSHTMPTGGYTDLTYFNGLFISMSGQGTATTVAATSPDGVTWTSRTMPASVVWSGVANNGTTAVAVAGGYRTVGTTAGTQAASSTNGTTWTSQTLPSSQTWSGVAYGNGIFVAVHQTQANANVYATSTDGATWTNRTSMPSIFATSNCTSIAFTNGKFIVHGTNTRWGAYSTDGLSWTTFALGGSGSWYGHASDGVATGVSVGASQIASTTTPSAQTWTCPPNVTQVQALAVGGGGSGGSPIATTGAGGGGGGGQVLLRTLTVVPGTTYNITVGAGGIGGNGSITNPGTATTFGTSFYALLTAAGGGGGGVGGSPTNVAGSGGGAGATVSGLCGGGGGGAGGAGGQVIYGGTSATGMRPGGAPVGGSGGGVSGGGAAMSNTSGSAIGGNGGPGLYGYGAGGGGGSGFQQHGFGGGSGAGRGALGGATTNWATSGQLASGGGGGGGVGLGLGGHGGSGYLRLDWWV